MDTSNGKFETIDEYIDSFPSAIKEKLQLIRQTVREAAPEAQEKISYQMPTFALHGNLVYFAAAKKHIGFYPTSSGMGSSIEGIDQYRTGKGTLQFPLDEPLPLELIRQVVEFRVKENLEKKAKK